jgi:hypothetical protein
LRALTAAGGEAGRNGRIDIEHRTLTGLSALHMAVDNNDPAIVAMLVAHGADPAAQTTDGESALDRCMAMEACGDIGALTLGPGGGTTSDWRLTGRAGRCAFLHFMQMPRTRRP